MPRTSSLCLRRISSSSLCRGLDHVTVAVDQRGEVLHRAEGLLDFETSLPGLGAGDGVDFETPLGLLQATLEELLTLVQAGVADLEILTAVGQLRRAGVEPGPGLAASRRRLGLGRFVRIERRHQSLELGDPAALAIQPFVGLADGVLKRLQLGLRCRDARSERGPTHRSSPRNRRRGCRAGG